MNSCESCGMPLEQQTTSKFDSQYCIYCQDQTTEKLKTFEEVRSGSIDAAMRLMGKTKKEAEQMANTMLPKLPRWKN